MNGLLVFKSVAEAIRAGYEIISPHADSEGYLHARIKTNAGFALALVAV